MGTNLVGMIIQYGPAVVWMAMVIIFLIVELITVGLTTIWLAGGALTAFILAALGVNIWWHFGVYLADPRYAQHRLGAER